MSISEIKWVNNILYHYRTMFYYSGTDEFDVNHRHRVGFLVRVLLKKYIKHGGLLRENNNTLAGWNTN